METARPVARRRSPEWAVGASAAAPGVRDGSTAQMWWGRSSATRAVSSATTDTRPGSVPGHRREETPATSVLAAAGRSPTPRGCDDRAARPRRSAACPAQQMREKLDDLPAADGARKQAEVEVPPRHPRDRRQRLPVEVILQDWRLSARRPGAATVRTLAQSAFVDEDNRPAFVFGLFFNSGQRCCFQMRIFSNRSASVRC